MKLQGVISAARERTVDFYEASPAYLMGNIIHFKEFWAGGAALLITNDSLSCRAAPQLLTEAVLAKLVYTHWVYLPAGSCRCTGREPGLALVWACLESGTGPGTTTFLLRSCIRA